jgi:hypothetical protein
MRKARYSEEQMVAIIRELVRSDCKDAREAPGLPHSPGRAAVWPMIQPCASRSLTAIVGRWTA